MVMTWLCRQGPPQALAHGCALCDRVKPQDGWSIERGRQDVAALTGEAMLALVT